MYKYNPYLLVIAILTRASGMTIYSLACEAGITPAALYSLYRRNGEPRIDTLARICGVFDISMSSFVQLVEYFRDNYDI